MLFSYDFTYFSTNDLLNYATGDRNISDKEYYECINILTKRSDDANELDVIMKFINTKLNSKYDQWKDIYKCLKLIDVMLKYGSSAFAYKMKYKIELIEVFTNFQYEVNGAVNIKDKANNIYQMLTSERFLEKERKRFMFEKEKEMKEEKKSRGGLLNSLGTYAFDSNFNDVKKYDLTGDADKQKGSDDDSESDSDSSKGSEDNQNYYQKMKKEQLRKDKANSNKKKELIVFENENDKKENNVVSNNAKSNDLFVFEFENDVSNTQVQRSNNNNNDLLNMNEFMNPVEDAQVKMINLQQALKTVNNNEQYIQNNNPNPNINSNYTFGYNNSFSISESKQSNPLTVNNTYNPNNPFNFISPQQTIPLPNNQQSTNQTSFDLLQF